MDSKNLLQLTDVALSRGAPANQPPSPLRSPTTSITTDRSPAPQTLRHFPSMPHINTFIQQNTQSPSFNRAPAPIPQTRSPPASPEIRRKQTLEQPPADFIEQISAVLSRFGLGIHQLEPQQSLQAPYQSSPTSPPSTLALSECEPLQNQCPILQTPQDSGVAGVRVTLPATGQRTGANPNPSPLSTSTSTPPLPFYKPVGSRRPQPPTQVGESPALHRVVGHPHQRVRRRRRELYRNVRSPLRPISTFRGLLLGSNDAEKV